MMTGLGRYPPTSGGTPHPLPMLMGPQRRRPSAVSCSVQGRCARQYRSFQIILLLALPVSYLVSAFLPSATPEIARRYSSRATSPLGSIANPRPAASARTSQPSRRAHDKGAQRQLQKLSNDSSIYAGGASAAYLVGGGLVTVASVMETELDATAAAVLQASVPHLMKRDPTLVRERLEALREAVPGCNMSALVLGAPRLALGLLGGEGGDALVESVRHTYLCLQEYVPSAYAADLVSRLPRLLLRDFRRRLEPHLHFLRAAFPDDMGYVLHKHPFLLTRSVGARLEPRLALLHRLLPGISSENMTALVSGNPELWTLTETALECRLTTLRGLIPHDSLVPILIRHPRTLTADMGEVVGPQAELLRACLQEETVQQVFRRLPSALYYATGLLKSKLSFLNELFGGANNAEAIVCNNPMVLAMDLSTTVRPKYDYLRSLLTRSTGDKEKDKGGLALFLPDYSAEEFMGMLKTEPGARLLTAGFGRLGRLSYVLQVNPSLSIQACSDLVAASSEETRKKYPGYENFLEDRIEFRFPQHTWEQICAVPFSSRERVHGEILHQRFVAPAPTRGDEEAQTEAQTEKEIRAGGKDADVEQMLDVQPERDAPPPQVAFAG